MLSGSPSKFQDSNLINGWDITVFLQLLTVKTGETKNVHTHVFLPVESIGENPMF